MLKVAAPLTVKAAVPKVEGTAFEVLNEPAVAVVTPLRLFAAPAMVFVPVAFIVLLAAEMVFVPLALIVFEVPVMVFALPALPAMNEPVVLATVVAPVEPSVPLTCVLRNVLPALKPRLL